MQKCFKFDEMLVAIMNTSVSVKKYYVAIPQTNLTSMLNSGIMTAGTWRQLQQVVPPSPDFGFS